MKNKENKKFGGPGKIAIVNSVTALRFIGSFLVVPVFQAFGGVIAAIYSGVFMLTDCIDGFLARKLKASTFFGSLFDGATDKIFVILAFALLLSFNPIIFSIPLLIELGIIGVQNKKMKKGLNVKSNFIGKVKTWILSASMVGSLAAVELLELKPFIEYIKTASLSKVGDIKDFLILLGVNLPGIIFQLLTLGSYSKESKEEVVLENQALDKEQTKAEDRSIEPETRLEEIKNEREKLTTELTTLEKAKAIGGKLFDPEYYAENKDKQIRTLVKDLYSRK